MQMGRPVPAVPPDQRRRLIPLVGALIRGFGSTRLCAVSRAGSPITFVSDRPGSRGDHPGAISRLASHKPGTMGSQNVSPRSKSVAAKAVSIAMPSRLSMPTQAASNVPRPSGIGPRVAAIDAIMKLTYATQSAGVSPKARNTSHSVRASSANTANSRVTVSASKTGSRRKIGRRFRDCL
jgi:hypothetical protein